MIQTLVTMRVQFHQDDHTYKVLNIVYATCFQRNVRLLMASLTYNHIDLQKCTVVNKLIVTLYKMMLNMYNVHDGYV